MHIVFAHLGKIGMRKFENEKILLIPNSPENKAKK
jgi:hypothetical protein